MKYQNVYIEAHSTIDPPEYLSTDQVEELLKDVYERLKLPEGRLELMTGIKRRGFWPRTVKPSDISTEAAEELFKKFNVNKDEIDLLIHCSVCRDQMEPSTVSSVHHALGLKPTCENFDLSNACLGMMSGMTLAANMIEAGQIKKALLVTGENSADLLFDTIDYLKSKKELTRKTIKDYIASLTIGSAGAAIVVGNDSSNALYQVLGTHHRTDSSAHKLCFGGKTEYGTIMSTDSEALLHKGVALGKQTFFELKDYLNQNFQKVITHQVGKAHQSLILEQFGLEEGSDFPIYPQFGNSGSAAIFTALEKARAEDFIKKGDVFALLGIGSGLHSNMAGLKCLN